MQIRIFIYYFLKGLHSQCVVLGPKDCRIKEIDMVLIPCKSELNSGM